MKNNKVLIFFIQLLISVIILVTAYQIGNIYKKELTKKENRFYVRGSGYER